EEDGHDPRRVLWRRRCGTSAACPRCARAPEANTLTCDVAHRAFVRITDLDKTLEPSPGTALTSCVTPDRVPHSLGGMLRPALARPRFRSAAPKIGRASCRERV